MTLCSYWRWERAEAEYGPSGISNPNFRCGGCDGCAEEEDEEIDANAALELHEQDHMPGKV